MGIIQKRPKWGEVIGTLSEQADLQNALAGKAASSHTHTLDALLQSGASTGQVPKWNGTNWVPANESGGGSTWGFIAGTLSNQTDLQAALDTKQNVISGTPFRAAALDSSGDLAELSTVEVSSKGAFQNNIADDFANSESHNIVSHTFNLASTENAPATSVTGHFTNAQIDLDDDGFSFGVDGNAFTFYAQNLFHEGLSDIGAIAFFNNYFTFGNGTDPIDVGGFGYMFGSGEIKSGVTIAGSVQGYIFQPTVRTGAVMDQNNSNVTAFGDFMLYEGESSFHSSFNASPIIDSVPSSKNYTGVNINPQIDTIAGGIQGISVAGTYGTFQANAYWHGINIFPTITESRYAAGLQVSMDDVTVYAGLQSSVTIQDLTVTFIQPGDNDNYSVQYLPGGTAGSESVVLNGTNIEITIESGVSTATQVKTALDAIISLSSTISTTITGTGSNAQTTAGPISFSGGDNPGIKLAAYLDGDVQITGALSFAGNLSIGAFNAFSSQPLTNGGGTPTSVHTLISGLTCPDNSTIALADTLGVNTAAVIQLGANSSITTAFLGVTALGLPAVANLGANTTVDRVGGAAFALSLDVSAGAGSEIDIVALCRSIAIPNGITQVNRLYGYEFSLPFGDPGTNTWSFYSGVATGNFFNIGPMKIGGSDLVANSSVALEIESSTRAFLNARMNTTARDALAAIDGMQIYNTSTNKLQVYASGAWVNLH